MQHKRNATIFKALCDEKRLGILELLSSGEKCACVLMEQMNMAQSALSYHMKILCQSGIVDSRQDGKWTHYHISEQGSRHASELILQLTSIKNQNSCCSNSSSSDDE